MNVALLALSYEELKARRDALFEMIGEPYRNIECSILISDTRVPALMEMNEALAVLQKARMRSALKA